MKSKIPFYICQVIVLLVIILIVILPFTNYWKIGYFILVIPFAIASLYPLYRDFKLV